MHCKATFAQGLQFYQQGNKPEAEKLFQKVIKREPNFAEAWNALGVMAQESGHFHESIELIKRAIAIQNKSADYHFNLAFSYCQLNQFDDEEKELSTTVQLDPNHLHAQCRLADIYRQLHEHTRAIPIYQKCMKKMSDNPSLFANLAICHLETGDIANAEVAAISSLRIDAENRTSLLVMSQVLIAKKRFEEAIRLLDKLVKVDPNFDHCFQLATAHMESGDYKAAIPLYKKLSEAYPQSVETIGNLGACHYKSGDTENAWHAFTHALSLEENGEFYNMLGMIRQKETRWEDAIEFYEKALALDPNLDKALANLGNLYIYKKRPNLAVDYLTRATQLFPENGEYRKNLAVAYMEMDNYDQAIAHQRASLNMAMTTDTVHFNLSQSLLATGQFEEGWREFRFRPSRLELLSQYPQVTFVLSLPDDLRGKRILLWAEQGIADELQFMRFIPLLKQRGAYCICQATTKSISIVKRLLGIDEVVPRYDRPPVDYEIFCSDLPMILGCNGIADIPPPLPMQALPEELASIDEQLRTQGPPPYIGLTWRGGTSLIDQKNLSDPRFSSREIDLNLFCNGARPLTGTFVALQRGPQEGELAQVEQLLGRPLLDFTALNDQLEAMLALLDKLDHYIAVPNTNVYFRDSLSKASQVMLSTPARYIWLRGTKESIWYPHSVLHRADIHNDWTAAFANMRASVASGDSAGDARHELALRLLDQGQFREAELEATRIIKSDATQLSAVLILSRALLGQMRYPEAISLLEKLVRIDASAENELQYAHALLAGGEFRNAAEQFERVLQSDPQSASLHQHLGLCYFKLGDYGQSKTHYQQAIALGPNPDLLYRLGFIEQKETRWQEAKQLYEQALAMQPDHDRTLDMLGNLYSHLQEYAQAIACHQKAIALKPDVLTYRTNLGFCYFEANRLQESEEQYRWVTQRDPLDKQEHFNLSQILLLRGELEAGWEEYNFRVAKIKTLMEHPDISFSFALPEDLHGKRVLLWAEQGIGDELLFMRLIPLLQARGATILCQCSDKITPLVRRLTDIDEVLPKTQSAPADYHVLLGDLPMILHCNQAEQIPLPLPLQPLDANLALFRKRLAAAGAPPYIGLTWRGGTALIDQKLYTDMKGGYREIALEDFAIGISEIQGTLVALQRSPQEGELLQLEQLLGRTLLDCTDLNNDLEAMLAALQELDHYIAVPNTNVYLRSSLPKISHVLVTTPPGFTWLSQGTESFWYPQAVLHRSVPQVGWRAALEEIRHALSKGNL